MLDKISKLPELVRNQLLVMGVAIFLTLVIGLTGVSSAPPIVRIGLIVALFAISVGNLILTIKINRLRMQKDALLLYKIPDRKLTKEQRAILVKEFAKAKASGEIKDAIVVSSNRQNAEQWGYSLEIIDVIREAKIELYIIEDESARFSKMRIVTKTFHPTAIVSTFEAVTRIFKDAAFDFDTQEIPRNFSSLQYGRCVYIYVCQKEDA